MAVPSLFRDINMAAVTSFGKSMWSSTKRSKDNMTAMTSFRKTLWKLTMREPVGKKELLLALRSYSFGYLAMKQHSHYQLCQSDHHQPTLAMLQSRGGFLCSCLVPTGRL
ncbi:uncharacterized protein LOC122961901 [Acropora millepora]|uniref:uncharacterized protein LOC122961901 n=1 Tax=Acropora millepora TaxID=45264 RepID=UPI001CF338EC|nr:uncharacterized protein LOC122961901 [Acropora millepora]